MKTQKNIEQALIVLLNQKSFRSITIADICEEALTSRSTFYLHYLDKYDLLEKIISRLTEQFEKVVKKRIHALFQHHLKNSLIEFYNEMEKKKDIIQILFKVTEPDYDLKQKYKDIIFNYWKEYLDSLDKETQVSTELIATIGTSIVMDILDWTLTHGVDQVALSYAEDLHQSILSCMMDKKFT